MVRTAARRTRLAPSLVFKALLSLASLPNHKPIFDLCKECELPSSLVIAWKRQLVESTAAVFGGGSHAAPPV